MGNDASKGKKSSSQSNNNSSIPSSKSSDNDSSEWNRVSPPSSPGNPVANSNVNFISIEDLGQSGVLVGKTGNTMAKTDMNTPVVGLTSAFTSPQGTSSHGGVNPNRRRIIKATPPPPVGVVATPVKEKDVPEDSPPHKQHLPAVLSPKASTELLEESIEQSKTKRLEQLSREQKSKRDKKLEERRKMGKSGSAGDPPKKDTPQANPFSKFLKIFSVDREEAKYHKRPYEEGDVDREEAVEADKAAGKGAVATSVGGRNSPSGLVSKRQKLDDDGDRASKEPKKSMMESIVESAPEWVPVAAGAAAMAVIAVMVALRINAATGGSNK
jgi:hypothetical protein